jgi:hypothetical protein
MGEEGNTTSAVEQPIESADFGLDGWGDESEVTAVEETEAAPETEETAEAEPAEEAEPESEPEAEEPRVKLRVNHQDLELPESELVTLAQKGMDYDRVKEQLTAAQNSREAQVLRRYAEQSGMPVEEYLNFLEGQARDKEVQKLVEGGMTPEAAGQFLEMKQRDEQRAAMEKQAAVEAQRINSFAPLVEKYPDVAQQKQLPAEVWQLIAQGYEPLPAYEHHLALKELASLKGQLAAKETDEKNRRTVPGSARGLAPEEEESLFMSGFNAR